MAEIFKNLFGGKAEPSQNPIGDDGFADFAGAPEPSPASILPSTSVVDTSPTGRTNVGSGKPYVYTKWYRIWERAEPKDFITEAIIIPFILIVVLIHIWGTRKNRHMAKEWMQAHAQPLQNEFSVVGYGGRKAPSLEDIESSGLLKALNSKDLDIPAELMKQKSAQEFTTYASGRQNVAYVDIHVYMVKRYNPILRFAEWAFSLFFETVNPPVEKMDAIAYPFDGHEKELVPVPGNQEIMETRSKGSNSGYDGFVWAVVNKDSMRNLRDDRYDVSLTSTKDHAKLPLWVTVMTEAAEITEKLLTNDLIKAIEQAGDCFEWLIVSDQPIDKPKSINETTPRKRIFLSMKLPAKSSSAAYESSVPLFNTFLRFADHLVSEGKFRPEVMRRVKAVREEEIRKLQRLDEEEKKEERNTQRDKQKKAERDKKLRNMTSEEQKKFLEREREKETRKQEKKMSRRA